MSGRLTTHVLDTARGRPAAGVRIELFAPRRPPHAAEGRRHERRRPHRRAAAHQLEAATLRADSSSSARYFGEGLYDEVPIRFRIEDAGAHYHVPLLVSPWSYSTYRGS